MAGVINEINRKRAPVPINRGMRFAPFAEQPGGEPLLTTSPEGPSVVAGRQHRGIGSVRLSG